MKINIEINNLTKERVGMRLVEKAAVSVIEGEMASAGDFEIETSIVFVDSERMREINKEYRNKNEATDVLSFAYDESGDDFPAAETKMLGELIVCPKRVKKDAREQGKTFKEELAWVIVHGILHLLGYDHEKGGTEAEKMRKKEKKYLKKNPKR